MTSATASRQAATISVIIPAYKAAQTIRRAIDSVLAQTVPPEQIIVVDDGSPDHQHAVLQQYGDRILLIRQANLKTAMARNAGLSQARGDFIAFLDADDYWEPDKLERQLAVFAKHPEVGVVSSTYFVEQPGTARVAACTHDRPWHDRVIDVRGKHAFRVATMMWTGTLMVRRERLGEEQFVSGLEPAEDRDMWVRLVLRGPVYVLSEPLSTAVLEPGSISRSSIDRDCSKMLEVIQRHHGTLGLLAAMAWRSHTLYRWSGMDPAPRTALPRLIQSFALWPLPYLGLTEMLRLGRSRRLIVLLMLAFRLRTSEAAHG